MSGSSASIRDELAAWLAAGGTRIGELAVRSPIPGQYELRHHLDAEVEGLEPRSGPAAARDIALYDAAGEYRPLKTAPNLRRGWRLPLGSIEELHEALDAFYPAMLAARLALRQGRLAVTPLRETLNRQSGMYAITKKLTDPQGDALAGSFCRTDGGCLKKILWPIAQGVPITSLPAEKFDPSTPGGQGAAFPLLCAEACNLLVAAARETVKAAGPAKP